MAMDDMDQYYHFPDAPINPDDVASHLWATSPNDSKLYATWTEVPENVKVIWRNSYIALATALVRAGYTIVRRT